MTKKVVPAEETDHNSSSTSDQDLPIYSSLNPKPSIPYLNSNTDINVEGVASEYTTDDEKTRPFTIRNDSYPISDNGNNNTDTSYNIPLGLTLSRVTTNDSENNDLERVDTTISQLGTRRPELFKSTFIEVLVVLVATMAPATISMASGSFQIAIKSVSEYFNVTGGRLTWIVSGMSVANGSFLLLLGGISDHFGRKRCFVTSFALYTIVSLVGGFCTNFVALNIMRALQGVVCAAAIPAGAGILGATYHPGPRKNKALACFAAGAPVGVIVGFVCGGICAQFLSWRAIMYFYAIIYSILTVIAYFVLPDDPDKLNWAIAKRKLKKMDFGGALIAIAGLLLFIVALTQEGAEEKGWKTPYIIALLIIGFFLIVGFCFYEIYIPTEPLMPMNIWKNKTFDLCMVIMSINWLLFNGVLGYYPLLYFEEIRGTSPMLTTAYIIPMAIGGISVNIFAAFTLHIIPGRILLITSSLGFLAATILWALTPIDVLYWAMPFPAFILVVVGADLSYNVVNMVALTSVPKELQSTASGIFNTLIQLGTAIGLSISSAIVSAMYPEYGKPGETTDIHKLYHAFKGAFYFAVGCAGAGIILSFFINVGTAGSKHDIQRHKDAHKNLRQQ